MSLEAGQTILDGKYAVERLLGQGGQSKVWLAREVARDVKVAIKDPLEVLSDLGRADLRERFVQEMRISGQMMALDVPNVVRVWTVEQRGDDRLLVMEYCHGGSLADRLRDGPLSIAEVVRLALDVCEALQAVHAKLDLVHRDIKPSNILFAADGTAKLGDFGLAQTSDSGRSHLDRGPHPGTRGYMCPEQEDSNRYLTPSCDLYALCCVLFEALTGERYQNHRPGTCAGSLRPEVPPWLDEVLAKGLQQDYWDRYTSADEMADDLRSGFESWQMELEAARSRLRDLGQRADEAERAGNWAGAAQALGELAGLLPGDEGVASRLRAAQLVEAAQTALARGSVRLALREARRAAALFPDREPVQEVLQQAEQANAAWLTRIRRTLGAILGGGAVLIVIALLWGKLACGGPLGPLLCTATPIATLTPTASPRPPVTPTAMVSTATPTAVVGPVISPVESPTDSPTSSQMLTHTATSAPLATETSIAPPTPTPPPTLEPAPFLLEPQDGADLKGESITFRWHWHRELAQDEHFDVRVWKEGAPHWGITWSEQPEYVAMGLAGGESYWNVLVLRQTGPNSSTDWQAVSEESEVWVFKYEAPPTPYPPGDINHDCVVDEKDEAILKAAYWCSIGDACYRADADLNKDGTIDAQDFGILSDHFGETC